MKFIKNDHIPQETSADQFESCIVSLTADNGFGFSDANLTPTGRKHNKALHIYIGCKGTTLSHVLVDIGSVMNILPKRALDRLDAEEMVMKPSD